MDDKILGAIVGIGVNLPGAISDVVTNNKLISINSIFVLIISVLTAVYVGYGIYKRILECKKLKKDARDK